MKKLLAFVLAMAIMAPTFSSVTPNPGRLKATDIMIPVKGGKTITLQDLATMKVADYAKLTGKKMKFFDRVGFKIAQKKLRSNINPDGTLSKKLDKNFRKFDGESGFHLGGFALGFFLGLIGVLIAYLINDDYKDNRVRWAWRGLLAGLLISLALIAAVL
jgi:hypothetical protein